MSADLKRASLSLDMKDLVLEFGKPPGVVRALDGITLAVPQGTILGIVGESGSGKSTIGFAAGRLMPEGVSPRSGKLDVLGQAIWDADIETLRQNVGLTDAKRVAAAWPHELSGGMAQRVVIAMAMVGEPKIIIADEATSALDASVRTRVLELLRNQSRERNIILLILSHDLSAVRLFCDRIAVIYAGRVVEHGPAKQVFANPAHPYTRALMAAIAGHEKPGEKLHTIPGIPPLLREAAPNCAFQPRCTYAVTQADGGQCDVALPVHEGKTEDWDILCHRWRDIATEAMQTEALDNEKQQKGNDHGTT